MYRIDGALYDKQAGRSYAGHEHIGIDPVIG